MSKSLGNVIAPQDVMKQSGADILRLWVVASDYAEDLRIGPEILKHMGDPTAGCATRCATSGRPCQLFAAEAMPSVDFPGDAGARALGAAPLAELDQIVRSAIDAYDFHAMFTRC